MKLAGKTDAKGKKFAIVVGRWNELVTKQLLEGALETLESAGAEDVDVVSVPGSWEVPLACRALIDKGVDGIVALGCILQGQTAHAKLLAADVAGALMNLQLESRVPIAWGILTPDDQDQALDRAGMKMGNKGREAAMSAVEMVSLLSSPSLRLRGEGAGGRGEAATASTKSTSSSQKILNANGTVNKAATARQMFAQGMSKAEIAKALGVRYQHVYNVLKSKPSK